MTTVAQLIEKLKTLPQEAEVECGKEVTRGYDTYMEHAPVDLDDMYAYDYSDRVKYPQMNGRIIVNIDAE
jgi:hypothetical protein